MMSTKTSVTRNIPLGVAIVAFGFILGHFMFGISWIILIFACITAFSLVMKFITFRQSLILCLILGVGHMLGRNGLMDPTLTGWIFIPTILYYLFTGRK